jgi:hypothetical protein
MWGNYIYLRKMIVKGRDNPEQFKFSKQNKPRVGGWEKRKERREPHSLGVFRFPVPFPTG